ncbi:MAG: hypothetical protein PHX08_13150, partial [Lachnospiraceae bacterium]|nr:hypothetical protein [Lachnospiraceae bacterium]
MCNDNDLKDKITIKEIHETYWRCRDFELSHLWRECNSNSVWFLFLLNLCKYNFFFLDLQMLLKAVVGCVQGRRG